jgi:hypothetical protein
MKQQTPTTVKSFFNALYILLSTATRSVTPCVHWLENGSACEDPNSPQCYVKRTLHFLSSLMLKQVVGLCILTACEGRVNGNGINSSVATSQRTHLVPTTNTCRLLLYAEIIVVYCKNHTEHKYNMVIWTVNTTKMTHLKTEHKCFGQYIIIRTFFKVGGKYSYRSVWRC